MRSISNCGPMTSRSIIRTHMSFGKTANEVALIRGLKSNFVDRYEKYDTPVKPANSNTVLREVPYNGGCSTWSGSVPIAMPRVSIIDGIAA